MRSFETLLLCQCPERGDLHFYDYLYKLVFTPDWCVNALKGATSISTEEQKAINKEAYCVNALKGATSISTRRKGDVCLIRLCVSMP